MQRYLIRVELHSGSVSKLKRDACYWVTVWWWKAPMQTYNILYTRILIYYAS